MNGCCCWLDIAEWGVSGEEVAAGAGVDDRPLVYVVASEGNCVEKILGGGRMRGCRDHINN